MSRKPENSAPTCWLIRFFKCSRQRSLFSKLSISIPPIRPLSSTPSNKVPPSAFKKATILFSQANSISLPFFPVFRLVRIVDLNSTLAPSPWLIKLCKRTTGSIILRRGRNPPLFQMKKSRIMPPEVATRKSVRSTLNSVLFTFTNNSFSGAVTPIQKTVLF